MSNTRSYLISLLENIRTIRENAGLTTAALEERLILGPGWMQRFESGETVPSIDMVLAILHETNATFSDLLRGLPEPGPSVVERHIFAEQAEQDLIIRFRYADYDAQYTLASSKLDDFEETLKTLRNGLARLVSKDGEQSTAVKSDSVARMFLTAVRQWPHANPSDLWWFLVYRAYCDPYNHPAQFARLVFSESWKRTSGWALEEILIRHYGPFLQQHGVNVFIADGSTKQRIIENLKLQERIEADKIDVVLTGNTPDGPKFFGIVHVKASFAERRTDDVPLSVALIRNGYTSPFWTMDSKSVPSTHPINRGELGSADGKRSAKRKDIEDEGYFTGCFSYNSNTQPSASTLPPERRVYVCDFVNPDDAFTQFILARWKEFHSS